MATESKEAGEVLPPPVTSNTSATDAALKPTEVVAPIPPAGNDIVARAAMVTNVVASISLVFVNKRVFNYDQFKQIPVAFTAFHFAVTGIALYVFSLPRINLFEPKFISPIKMLPLCLSFAGFVILTNLSLAYNSVAFYQMAKVLTTPTIVIINLLIYHKQITLNIGLALSVTCIGVALTCSGEFGTSVPGTVFAGTGVLVTSMYQVWIGTKQKEFGASSSQLLLNQAPLSAAMLAVLAPFCDTFPTLSSVPTAGWAALLLSGLGALVVNLSQFMIIGKTSAVTYNGIHSYVLCH